MADRIKVLVVDDEARLTKAWAALLATQPDMECVGTLHRADELVEKASQLLAQVVLLDLTMPGRDPLEAITELAAKCADVRTVIYSGYSDHESIRQAFDAGAWGYVDKLDDPAAILQSIRRVAGGEVAFPRSFST